MAEDDIFYIQYKGKQVKVTSVLNEAHIHFIIHLPNPVTIAETMINEEWVWYEKGKGDTPLAAELGKLIEDCGI